MGLLVQIRKDSSRALFRQIVDDIVEKIERGTLVPGDRLPPSRSLAQRLEINRTTVCRAYQELWALGYIESSPGSYSKVRRRMRRVSDTEDRGDCIIDWSGRSRPGAEELFRTYEDEERLFGLMNREAGEAMRGDRIDFASLSPDRSLFPVEEYRKCMNTVLVNGGPELLSYGEPEGLPSLRRFIARRMQLHGIHVDEKELLITAGAQSAIDLVFKTFTRPGDRVVLESPTYSRVIGQCELYDTQVLSIPMDEEGMIPEELERVCRRENPAMIYSIPNFHNPTGITSSHSRREEILRICERQRIPLIEDGFEEEMKYFGREVLPIKSMDRHGTVVYLGTFSKVLFPGVRIGWVAADRGAVARLAAVQKYSHLCGPPADQAALAQFCEKGLYDVHIKKMHRVYRSRMQTALEALEKHMPTGDVSWTRPAGGYTLWLRISRPGLEEERFLEACAARGVMLAPGRYFFTGSQGDLYFRISVGTVDAEHIERGIRLIAETIEEL